MIVGLYTSVTGKMAGTKNLDIIARNLANVNTTGFKKNIATFSTFMEGGNSINGVGSPKVSIDHGQGGVMPTGNKLDLAINGNGFFTMESDKGLKFTRNGRFLLNGDKEIVNDLGWKLMGDTGTLKLPEGALDVLVGESGSITADGVNIGKIKITDFKDKTDLKEVGSSAFASKSNSEGEEVEPEDFGILQTFLENSNVNIVEEMITMISNNRSFQGNNSVNRTIDRTLERLIRSASTVI